MKKKASFRYVVITPVRDEACYVSDTLESVSTQTLKPQLWVIVDDCSKDETPQVVEVYAKKHPWIKIIRLNRGSKRYPGSPVISAFRHGLEQMSHTNFDFIVKLDGDLRLPEDYFERLLSRFEADASLGIASGVYLEKVCGEWEMVKMPDYHAAGASKVVRRECFHDIGGFVPSLGWDTIDELRARVKGWRTTHFTDIRFYHLKNEGSGIGRLRTSAVHGRIFYLTGGSLLYFAIKALRRAIWGRPPVISGVFMLWGYLKAALLKEVLLVSTEEAALYNALLSERISSKAKNIFS